MKVKNDNLFLFRSARIAAIYLFVVVVGLMSGIVRAEVSTLPPNTSAPMTQVIQNAPHGSSINYSNGYRDTKVGSGSWTAGNNTINLPKGHFGGSKNNGNGTVTSTKTHGATFTDGYGQKATGKVSTATTSAWNKVAAGAGAVYMGNMAGNAVQRANGAGIGSEIANGNYGEAARIASASFADAVYGGAFSGLKDILDDYQNTKAQKAADELAAAKQAADLAAQQSSSAAAGEVEYWQINLNLFKYNDSGNQISDSGWIVVSIIEIPKNSRPDSSNCCLSKSISGDMISLSAISKSGESKTVFEYELNKNEGGSIVASSSNKKDYDKFVSEQLAAKSNPENFFLTESEFVNAVLEALQNNTSSINQNTEALNDLINELWINEQLTPANTETSVTGSEQDNTHLTNPYTPQGKDTAQQTGFKVAPNGIVTSSTIPRPDLPANSPSAPTVAPTNGSTTPTNSGGTNTGGGGGDKKKDDDDVDIDINKKKDKDGDIDVEVKVDVDTDVCDEDDADKVVCLPAGSDKKDELALPVEEVKIHFDKDEYFAEDGVCPKPINITWGGISYEMSWQPFCDVASGLRPVIELLGVLTALGFAYGAIREL